MVPTKLNILSTYLYAIGLHTDVCTHVSRPAVNTTNTWRAVGSTFTHVLTVDP